MQTILALLLTGARDGELSLGERVLVDPDVREPLRPETLRSRAGTSRCAGLETSGWPVVTFLRDNLAHARHAPPAQPRGASLAFG